MHCVCRRLFFWICLQGYLWVYRMNSARGRESEGYLGIWRQSKWIFCDKGWDMIVYDRTGRKKWGVVIVWECLWIKQDIKRAKDGGKGMDKSGIMGCMVNAEDYMYVCVCVLRREGRIILLSKKLVSVHQNLFICMINAL